MGIGSELPGGLCGGRVEMATSEDKRETARSEPGGLEGSDPREQVTAFVRIGLLDEPPDKGHSNSPHESCQLRNAESSKGSV